MNTEFATPSKDAKGLILPKGTLISRETPLVTFVNRVIKLYRGCHTLIRSIPTIHRINSKAETVVIGNALGVDMIPLQIKAHGKITFSKKLVVLTIQKNSSRRGDRLLKAPEHIAK